MFTITYVFYDTFSIYINIFIYLYLFWGIFCAISMKHALYFWPEGHRNLSGYLTSVTVILYFKKRRKAPVCLFVSARGGVAPESKTKQQRPLVAARGNHPMWFTINPPVCFLFWSVDPLLLCSGAISDMHTFDMTQEWRGSQTNIYETFTEYLHVQNIVF